MTTIPFPCHPEDAYNLFFAYNRGTADFIKKAESVALLNHAGEMRVRSLTLNDLGITAVKSVQLSDKPLAFDAQETETGWALNFKSDVMIPESKQLLVKLK
ncbi:MAG: hypothetical protein U5R06_21610 [candidate division KSB1 bacterium]|nr:hypothetical protein [candidate division KSB1 bacterium]